MSATVCMPETTAVCPAGERGSCPDTLRPGAGATLMVLLVVTWMLYTATGFRNPLQPIQLSDADANPAIRQALFSLAGMVAFVRLFLSGLLGTILSQRLRFVTLCGLLLLSVLWSAEPSVSLKRSIIFVFGMLTLLVVVHSSERPVRMLLQTVFSFCCFVAAASILGSVLLPAACTVNPARPGLAGITIHPNTLAPFLSIGWLLSLGITEETTGRCTLLIAGRCLLLVALVMTFSITTWTTTLVGTGLFLFLNGGNYRRGIYQLMVAAVLVAVFWIGIETLRSTFFDATGRDESLSGRDELWLVVWHKSLENPVVGNGFGGFWTEGKGRELVQTWNPRQSHNAYLDVLLDLGFLGLGIVLIVITGSLFVAWLSLAGVAGSAQRRAVSSMTSVACAYLFLYAMGQSFFLKFDVFPFFILMWIVLVLTNGGSKRVEAEFAQEAAS